MSSSLVLGRVLAFDMGYSGFQLRSNLLYCVCECGVCVQYMCPGSCAILNCVCSMEDSNVIETHCRSRESVSSTCAMLAGFIKGWGGLGFPPPPPPKIKKKTKRKRNKNKTKTIIPHFNIEYRSVLAILTAVTEY